MLYTEMNASRGKHHLITKYQKNLMPFNTGFESTSISDPK